MDSAVTVKILKRDKNHQSAEELSISLWCWNDRRLICLFFVKQPHKSRQPHSSLTERQEIIVKNKRGESCNTKMQYNKQHNV